MKKFSFLLLLLTLSAPSGWGQAFSFWERLAPRQGAVASAKLSRKAAFARQSHFANQRYLFSPAEKARLYRILQEEQHLSPKAIQKLLLTRPSAAAKCISVPALQKGKAVFISDFTPFLVSRVQHLPAYPAALFPEDVARGMVLRDPNPNLHEIFSKGLLTRHCALDGWTRKQVIFMVHSTQIASLYARTDTPGLPVIVHISGFHGQQNYMPESDQDIPAQRIVRVSALINLKGKLVWGQLTPAASGFLFHPYRLSAAQSLQHTVRR